MRIVDITNVETIWLHSGQPSCMQFILDTLNLLLQKWQCDLLVIDLAHCSLNVDSDPLHLFYRVSIYRIERPLSLQHISKRWRTSDLIGEPMRWLPIWKEWSGFRTLWTIRIRILTCLVLQHRDMVYCPCNPSHIIFADSDRCRERQNVGEIIANNTYSNHVREYWFEPEPEEHWSFRCQWSADGVVEAGS